MGIWAVCNWVCVQVTLDQCMGSNGGTLERLIRTCMLTIRGKVWTSWLKSLILSTLVLMTVASSCLPGIQWVSLTHCVEENDLWIFGLRILLAYFVL